MDATLALSAEIGMANAGWVGQRLGSAVEPGVRTVIADMTATTFVTPPASA